MFEFKNENTHARVHVLDQKLPFDCLSELASGYYSCPVCLCGPSVDIRLIPEEVFERYRVTGSTLNNHDISTGHH